MQIRIARGIEWSTVAKTWQRAAAVAGLIGLAAAGATALWFRRVRYAADWQPVTVGQPDGQSLAAQHLGQGRQAAVIVAHGLRKSMHDRRIHKLAYRLGRSFDVITFDFPGHGLSDGVADLDMAARAQELGTVVQQAREMGYRRVGVVGCSMGAAAAIIAGTQDPRPDAVVAVSVPAAPPAGDLAVPTEPARWLAAALGTRLAPRLHSGIWPIEVVDRVSPVPLLIVHNELDTLVSRKASQALFAVARPPKQYLSVPGALHAATARSVATIIAWLAPHLEREEPPDLDELPENVQPSRCEAV